MSAFQDMVASDRKAVFLNPAEFGEYRTIEYDGTLYTRVSVVIRAPKQESRSQMQDDHAAGLYLAGTTLHCCIEEIGGIQPEQGQKIRVSDPDGFMRPYYIATSFVEVGMCHLTLEAIDE